MNPTLRRKLEVIVKDHVNNTISEAAADKRKATVTDLISFYHSNNPVLNIQFENGTEQQQREVELFVRDLVQLQLSKILTPSEVQVGGGQNQNMGGYRVIQPDSLDYVL